MSKPTPEIQEIAFAVFGRRGKMYQTNTQRKLQNRSDFWWVERALELYKKNLPINKYKPVGKKEYGFRPWFREHSAAYKLDHSCFEKVFTKMRRIWDYLEDRDEGFPIRSKVEEKLDEAILANHKIVIAKTPIQIKTKAVADTLVEEVKKDAVVADYIENNPAAYEYIRSSITPQKLEQHAAQVGRVVEHGIADTLARRMMDKEWLDKAPISELSNMLSMSRALQNRPEKWNSKYIDRADIDAQKQRAPQIQIFINANNSFKTFQKNVGKEKEKIKKNKQKIEQMLAAEREHVEEMERESEV